MKLVRAAMQDAYGYDSKGFQSHHLFWNTEDGKTTYTFGNTTNVRNKPTTNGSKVVGSVTAGTVDIEYVVKGDDGKLWGKIEGKDQYIWLEGLSASESFDPGEVPEGYDGVLNGGTVESAIIFNFKDEADGRAAWFREMTVDGPDGEPITVYVYCGEHGTAATPGNGFTLENITNGKDKDGNDLGDKSLELQYIAQNGYWGTEASMNAMKALLGTLGFSDKDADRLTEGMAMAVTQAAIWAQLNGTEFDEQAFTKTYLHTGDKQIGNLDKIEVKILDALFEALTSGKAEADTTTQLITSESITSTTVKINSKVEDIDAAIDEAVAAIEGASKPTGRYDTDVSFTIAVVPDRMNGKDLTVKVYNGSTLVGEYALDGEQVTRDGNTYTISGIKLMDGVGVELKLSGAQVLAEGAYLFHSELSQDQVGISDGTGERTVDVTVSMDFSVKAGSTETSSEAVNKTWTEVWQESNGYKQEQERTDITKEEYETRTTVTVRTETETETTVEKETSRVEWHDEWHETFEKPTEPTPPPPPTTEIPPYEPPAPPEEPPVNPPPETDIPEIEVPLDPGEPPHEDPPPEEDIPDEEPPLSDTPTEEEDIPDEDVPLSDIPKTGDDSNLAVYYVLAAVCGMGLCVLAATGKKRDELQ